MVLFCFGSVVEEGDGYAGIEEDLMSRCA